MKNDKRAVGAQSLQSLLKGVITKIDERSEISNGGVTGLTSGYMDLDQLTTGFQSGDFIIVAARPAMGKTTFALNISEHIALSENKPVLFFSLGMQAPKIVDRILCSLSRIDNTKFRSGQLNEYERNSLSTTIRIIIEQNMKITIDDTPRLTPSDLRDKACSFAAKNNGIGLIVVDYLQLISAPSFSNNRTSQVSEVSRSLKALAMELQCPLIALSQLNRGVEQRTDKRPINTDLRDSGSLEDDSDLILFIYRDEVYNVNTKSKGVAEIILSKHRNAPIGRVKLFFQGRYCRFDEYFEL